MVGTGQPCCVSLSHDYLHIAMTADVGERPQLVIGAAHDDQRFAGQFESKVIAGVLCLFFTSDADPVAAEQVFEFEFVEFFGQVRLGRQPPGFLKGGGE